MKIEKILVLLSLLVFIMVIGISVVLGAGAGSDAEIAAYPTRTIEIICPWGAGGGTDAAIRGYAQYIQKYAGQTVTVRNIEGGTGSIAWNEGAQAHPDGYRLTLLTFDIIPVEVQQLAPVSYRSYEPIGTFTRQPLVLGVRADKPWHSLEDIVKAAKEAGPGVLTTGAAAITWAGITNALFQDMAGIEFTSTSYSGFGDQVRETLGGHIDIVFATPGVYFNYPEDKIQSVKRLGDGPFRVWRNRMKGTTLGVWENEYNNTITADPASGYDYPEFKGFFSSLYWARLKNKDQSSMTINCHTPYTFLRLFTPETPESVRKGWGTDAMEYYEGDLSFLNAILPIGTMFKEAKDLGPQSQIETVYGWDAEPVKISLTFDFRK